MWKTFFFFKYIYKSFTEMLYTVPYPGLLEHKGWLEAKGALVSPKLGEPSHEPIH